MNYDVFYYLLLWRHKLNSFLWRFDTVWRKVLLIVLNIPCSNNKKLSIHKISCFYDNLNNSGVWCPLTALLLWHSAGRAKMCTSLRRGHIYSMLQWWQNNSKVPKYVLKYHFIINIPFFSCKMCLCKQTIFSQLRLIKIRHATSHTVRIFRRNSWSVQYSLWH